MPHSPRRCLIFGGAVLIQTEKLRAPIISGSRVKLGDARLADG